MRKFGNEGVKRMMALQAISAAVFAAAVVSLPAQPSAAAPQRGGRIAGVNVTPANQPAGDADNTENSGDLGTPPAGNLGDLMSTGTTVYVDDSFATGDKLKTANRLASQNQSQLAIKAYQEIADKYGQKLVLKSDGMYLSATDYVRASLVAMPAVKNGMYDQLFGSDAQREVDAAIDNRDVTALIRACDRYYPSTAALKGLCQAAEWYFERGEFISAAQTWRNALAHPRVGDRKAQILFSAAIAEALAQNKQAAQALHDQLAGEFPDAAGTVSGKEVKLLAKLDEIMALPAWDKTDLAPDEWPAFEGGASHSRLLSTSATIGARLWGMSFSNGLGMPVAYPSTDDRQQQAILQQQMALRGIPQGTLNSYPVISNGVLFVHSGEQIIAMSVNAGAKLWAYPQDASSAAPDPAQLMRTNGVGRLSSHDSASVYGEQVFAVLPATASNRVAGVNYINGVAMTPARLVCLNRDDGTQLWSRMASEVKLDKEGSLTFVGSPIVTRQGVFVMARKLDNANFTQQYLVRFDRDTGEPAWSCYLCSTNNMYNAGGLATIPIPTLVDDVVYISTGQGADCAVDANAGRILWLRPTATASATAGASGQVGFVGGFGGRIMIQTISMQPSWKFNAPLVIGDHVLTTDNGQSLRIYNRWTGALLRTISASELLPDSSAATVIDVLAGAIGTKVVLSIGNHSVCYDIESLLSKNPRPFWSTITTAEIAGSPTGRPFLSATGYYVPFANKLVRIDTRTGKAALWDWPKNDQEIPGNPGNLLVTSEQVIVVNDAEVAGYSKWETARDNRLAMIQANPKDPAPYLALAEIGFRTDHPEVAQSNMEQSVKLATAGAIPPGESNADFLGRLYRTNLAFAEQLFSRQDSKLWPMTRFYFEQCRATARQPEQQVEWRMRLADLARAESKPEEAVALYTQVLTDPALRVVAYNDRDLNQNAGSTAEQRIRDVIKSGGIEVFKLPEEQAAALAQRGVAGKDTAMLQQVIDGYPNSTAAIGAATTLVKIYQEKQAWESARRVLFWLQPRVLGVAEARTVASLVSANIALKKYAAATELANRGARMYKDFTWSEDGKNVSFTDVREQIARLGGAELTGSLPSLHATSRAPELESGPGGYFSRNDTDLTSFLQPLAIDHNINLQMLAPIETAPRFRAPNLLFVRNGDKLIIIDTKDGNEIASNIALGQNADTVLLGSTRENAVLLQRDRIIGVDLKTFDTWTVQLKGTAVPPPAIQGRGPAVNRGRLVQVPPGASVQIVGGNVLINGNNYGSAETITLVDQNGNPYSLTAPASDPEAVRRDAFAMLGNQMRFTTASMLNGNIYILAGKELSALDVKTGKPIWASSAAIPNGVATCFVGNEDLIVAQSDDAGGKSSTFIAFDAQSGKLRKTLKLQTPAGPEHALWRGIGGDDTLYVITDASTAAYDLVSDLNAAVWRSTGVGSRFAGAAALTLDGLIVVDDKNTVQCLALDSGAERWKKDILDGEAFPIPTNGSLRSALDGDLVLFQSTAGCTAFRSAPVNDMPSDSPSKFQRAWTVVAIAGPARKSIQFSDQLAVEFLQGSSPNQATMGANAMTGAHMVLVGLSGGKMQTNQPVVSRDSVIRNWQVLDGGIAFELIPAIGNAAGNNVAGQIYFWKTVKPAAPTASGDARP